MPEREKGGGGGGGVFVLGMFVGGEGEDKSVWLRVCM